MDGLLLIDKTGDCTSHDVVQQIRRLFRQKKVGHCGTLDPTATGLLLLTLGKATRLTRFLIRAPKVYIGSIRFGQVTDTFDAAGEVTDERSTDGLTLDAIIQTMQGFVGDYEHLTPAYSAKKTGGRKRYELARRGDEVPEERKLVHIYAFDLTGDLAGDQVHFRLACESGTYARSLAHELGLELGCGAHLSSLRRTAVGPFEVADAMTIERLEAVAAAAPAYEAAGGGGRPIALDADALDAEEGWIPMDDIPLPFANATLDGTQERRLRHGQTVLMPELEGSPGDWVRLANRRGQFIAVGAVTEVVGSRNMAVVQPKIVFA